MHTFSYKRNKVLVSYTLSLDLRPKSFGVGSQFYPFILLSI